MGERVLTKEQNKKNALESNWQGPFEVIPVHGNENITIKKRMTRIQDS